MQLRTAVILWIFIALVSTFGLRLDVMEPDAAQYAAISAEMKASGNYLHLFHRGEDYLDKPPLLFWLAAGSFHLFGENNVAYKLPAILILILGLWSLYKLTRLYATQETALLATTIFGTTQAFFLMTHDVRTDGLLTGFVVFTVYHCMAWFRNRHPMHILAAAIGIGCAMLAKGPVGAAIPVIVVAVDRLLKGRWRDLLRYEWIVAGLIALVMLVPMCYGLYTQFDLHPEKTVYGLQGPSGLKFFFWTQSFGRLTGDIYWDNNAPFYFFLLTFLWDFMPWVLVFGCGLVYGVIRMKKEGRNYPEYFSGAGAFVILLLLSLSRYKLPHYIFPLLPFAAILTARYLSAAAGRHHRVLSVIQFGLLHLFFGVIGFAFVKAFPPDGLWLPLLMCAAFAGAWVTFLRSSDVRTRIWLPTMITAIAFNLFMAAHFYPHLLQYQSGAQAGKVIAHDKAAQQRSYYIYPRPSYALDFYAGAYVPVLDPDNAGRLKTGDWIIVQEEAYDELKAKMPGFTWTEIDALDHYHISMLKWGFVMKESREKYISQRRILRVD